MTAFNPSAPNYKCPYAQEAYATMRQQAIEAGCWNSVSYPILLSYAHVLALYSKLIDREETISAQKTDARYQIRLIRCLSDMAKHWNAAIRLSKARVTEEVSTEVVDTNSPSLKLVSSQRHIGL